MLQFAWEHQKKLPVIANLKKAVWAIIFINTLGSQEHMRHNGMNLWFYDSMVGWCMSNLSCTLFSWHSNFSTDSGWAMADVYFAVAYLIHCPLRG